MIDASSLLCCSASASHTVVHWRELGEVENECTSNKFNSSWPFWCQKLSRLVEIWRSSVKSNLARF